MSDEEILTPEEKDALLKGVEDGDVATEAGEAARVIFVPLTSQRRPANCWIGLRDSRR